MWQAIKNYFDCYLPRFITEDVVCRIISRRDTGSEYLDTVEMVKPLHWVEPGEDFDYIVTLRFFNLFGRAIFTQHIGEPRHFIKDK